MDQEFAAKLAKASKLIQISGRGHGPVGGNWEHALEVQLPFLQRALGQFKLVPIVMGDQSYEACRALGLALAKNMQGTNTIIVASSDLSHYHPYDDAVKLDHKTLKAIEEWDYLSMSQNFERQIWEACGGGPIIAAMIASERLGARQAQLPQVRQLRRRDRRSRKAWSAMAPRRCSNRRARAARRAGVFRLPRPRRTN